MMKKKETEPGPETPRTLSRESIGGGNLLKRMPFTLLAIVIILVIFLLSGRGGSTQSGEQAASPSPSVSQGPVIEDTALIPAAKE